MGRFFCAIFLLLSQTIFQPLNAQNIRFVTSTGSGVQNGLSWMDAYPASQLQTTIDTLAALGGGEVWVGYGTYYPTVPFDNDNTDLRKKSFNMRTNVEVYGGFTGTETAVSQRVNFGENGFNETILSGNLGDLMLNSDNSYHVVYVATGVTSSLLNGVTVADGNANHASSFSEDDGAGVYANGGFSIQQCVIKNNAADDDGGGLFMKSNTVISHCTIHSNSAGAEGGGILLLYFSTSTDPQPLVEYSLIYGNSGDYGGGIFQKTGGVSNFNKVIGNTARYGAGIYLQNAGEVNNSLIANNKANFYGGGLYLYYGGYGTSNTIVSNDANSGGAGVNRQYGTGSVTNSVIWNNKTQVRYQGSGVAVAHCAVEGGFSGSGAGSGIINLNPDNTGIASAFYPAFASPTTFWGISTSNLNTALLADWQLTCHSACIDAGSIALVPAWITTDLAGNPRTTDGNGDSLSLPDLGAFEFSPIVMINHAMCTGDTLYFAGTPITAAGQYIDTLPGIGGCDSIVLLNIMLWPSDTVHIHASICSGDSVPINGQYYSAAGVFFQTAPSPSGCDTLIVIDVTVFQPDTVHLPLVTLYENQSYNFFGQMIQTTGVYTHTLVNTHDCDSLIVQQINVIPVDTILQTGLCSGDTLLFGPHAIVTAGDYYYTIPGTLAPDSVIQIQVVLFPADTTWLTPALLPMGSSHPFHGTNITAPGTYYHTLTAQTGCDSILVLQVLPRVYVRQTGAGSQNGHGWNNAYPGIQLQAAINFVSAAGGGEVWVAKGTYKPTAGNDRQLRFMVYGNVELYGGFSGNETQLTQRTSFGFNQVNQTSLSGDINNPSDTSDNSYFIIQQFNASFVLIDGFIIRDASNPVSFLEGAGVILKPGGVLRNCMVYNNNTTTKGGGVFSTGGVIENCTIQGNRAGSYGGGVLMQGGEIRNSLINNNTANTGGAGIQAEMGQGLITGCTISHNNITSYGWGGGLSLDGSVDTMQIENTTFSHNQAVLGGGAYTSGNASEYIFVDCFFLGNTAVDYFAQSTSTTYDGTGGAMILNHGRVKRCQFDQNSATIGGGVWMLGDAVIDSSLFKGNQATNRGGGVFQFQQATLTSSTLTGNNASQGGAIFIEGGLVTQCLVDSNTSSGNGGGIYATGGAVVRECDLVANFGHYGGGAYLAGISTLERCIVHSNRAHYNGAGVFNSANDAPVINCNIFKNYARYHGGGIYNDVSNAGNGQIINTTIHNNSAGYHGGGIYGYFGGELINCNINRNHADGLAGGVYINYKTKIRNSVIWGNNTQIHTLGTPSGMTIDTSAVQGGYTGNGAGSLVLALDSLNDGNDTTLLYPRFIFPTTFSGLPGNITDSIALFASDWNLGCASSLIDRGSNSALPDTITHDLAGNLRFANGLQSGDTLVDLGALEAVFNYDISVTLCPGDTFFLGNMPLTLPGTYTDTVTTSSGCDHTMTVHITVLPSDTGYTYVDICQGDAYFFGSQLLTQSGQYSETFQGHNGCDSLVILTLQVHLPDTTTLYPSICQGNVFIYNGQGYNTAGIYHVPLPSTGFCDSIIRIVLTANPIDTTSLQHTLCQGDSILFAGNWLSVAGTYQHLFTASSTCDSLVTLLLHVISPDTASNQQLICLGDTINFFGIPLHASGMYFHTLLNSQQCDSVIQLDLQVIQPDSILLQQTICHPDTFLFFGTPLHTPGSYCHTLVGSFQCDSIISLDLSVIYPDTTDLYHQMCDGEILNFYGTSLTTTGSYLYTLNASGGCDSIIRMNLTVFPMPQKPAISILNDTLFSLSPVGNQWLFQQQPLPGANGVYLLPQQNGQYAVLVTNQHGCISDTSNTVLVYWISVTEPTGWPEAVKVYPNPAIDQLHIELPEGMVFTYRLHNRTGQVMKSGEVTQSISLSLHHLAGGLYILELINPDNEVFRLKVLKK